MATPVPQSPVEKLIEDVKDVGENALWLTAGFVDFTTAEGLQIAKNLLGMGSSQLNLLQKGVDQLFLDTGLMGLMDQLIDRGKKYEPPFLKDPGNQLSFVNIPIVPLVLDAKDPGGLPLTYKDHGTLPPGLILNTAVTPPQIQGMPTIQAQAASPHVCRITVENSFGMDTSVVFMWFIDIAPPVITQIPDYVQPPVPTPINVQAVDNGGFTPLTYAAANLPPGVNINPVTGVISGTPTSPAGAFFVVQVTVTNTAGKFSTDVFNWTT